MFYVLGRRHICKFMSVYTLTCESMREELVYFMPLLISCIYLLYAFNCYMILLVTCLYFLYYFTCYMPLFHICLYLSLAFTCHMPLLFTCLYLFYALFFYAISGCVTIRLFTCLWLVGVLVDTRLALVYRIAYLTLFEFIIPYWIMRIRSLCLMLLILPYLVACPVFLYELVYWISLHTAMVLIIDNIEIKIWLHA